MKILNQLKENKGFTLIELMVSVCIMAIAFAGLATMQIACINGNAIASNLTSGITLAQDKLEELNSLDYFDDDLDDNNTSNNVNLRAAICDDTGSYPVGHECDGAGDAQEDDGHREDDIDGEGNAGGMYTRIWNVSNDDPMGGRKTVVVIVIWQNHQVSVSSIFGAPFS